MNIFIDAYNLLKQLHATTRVSVKQKNVFLQQLKTFARLKKHNIFLVYDGGELERLDITRDGSIAIMHSGYTFSADDIIKQKMVHYAPEHSLLVSDDRELCDYLAYAGYAAIATHHFYRLLQQDNEILSHVASMKKGSAQKMPGYMCAGDIDNVMQEASLYPDEKNVDIEDDDSYSQTLSKKEKKLKKIVKKI